MRGTAGAKTIPQLEPLRDDHVLEERTRSAFHETGLDLILRSIGVDSVVITELHTNICDRHTAADAFHRGYKVVVPSDCVQALTDEEHRSGLDYLDMMYEARICSSEELLAEWRPQDTA